MKRGNPWAPLVRPTTLEEVLNVLDVHAWAVRKSLPRLRPDSYALAFMEGRRAQVLGILRECGALPRLPRPSLEAFERALAVAFARLPCGFEHMPVAQAREFLVMHGVKATLDEVPYLQRHLVAGLRHQEHIASVVTSVAKPD